LKRTANARENHDCQYQTSLGKTTGDVSGVGYVWIALVKDKTSPELMKPLRKD
jgi:hypothetical protein